MIDSRNIQPSDHCSEAIQVLRLEILRKKNKHLDTALLQISKEEKHENVNDG